MRQALFTIAFFFLFNTTKAQCPAGAQAMVVFYVHIIGLGPDGPIIDTANVFYVSNFQPNTTVYFYNAYNTLIDSVYTSSDGSGTVNLSPAVYDSIEPFSGSWVPLGIATNGICTTDVGSVALLPVKISNFTITNSNNTIAIDWQTEMDEPGTKYIIQQSDNGTSFTDLKTIISTSSNTGRYSYSGYLSLNKTKYFRIKIVNGNGSVSYSEIKATEADLSQDIIVYTSSNSVSVSVPANYINGSYALYNSTGYLLTRDKILSANFTIHKNIAAGIYFVRATDNNGNGVAISFIAAE